MCIRDSPRTVAWRSSASSCPTGPPTQRLVRSDPRSSDPAQLKPRRAQRASPTAAPRSEHQETTTTRAREPTNGGRCNLTDPRSIPTIPLTFNPPRRGPEQLLLHLQTPEL